MNENGTKVPCGTLFVTMEDVDNGLCTSTDEICNTTTGGCTSDITDVPTITTNPINTTTTSISGTVPNATGSFVLADEVALYVNDIGIGTATVAGNAWTVTGLDLSFYLCDNITATSNASDGCVSNHSTPITVTQVSTAPTITAPNFCGTTTSISGKSFEADGTTANKGATVYIYLNGSGTAESQTGTVNSLGFWSIGGLTLPAGTTIQATVIDNNYCQSESPLSNQITIGTPSSNTGITISIGDNVVFTLTVTNNGASNATGVSVSDQLPTGYTYVSDDGSGAYVSGTGVWTIGNLANAATATLKITCTVKASGSYANTATVSGNENDPNNGDNTSTSTPAVGTTADIVLTKVADKDNVNEGDTVSFTITVKNDGPADATNLKVTDNLTSGLSLISATPSIGSWTSPDWTVGTLTNGATENMIIKAKVGTGTAGTNITNIVSNTQDQTDNNGTTDDNTEVITVNGGNNPPIAVADYDTVKVNSQDNILNIAENDSDIDGDLDKSSIIILQGQQTQADLQVLSGGIISYTPEKDYLGDDYFIYEISDIKGNKDADTVFIYVMPGIETTDGFSPNNDGINETFYIKGIEKYPDNEVFIYNRWGNLVFHTSNYKNDINAWDGKSQSKINLGKGKLPVGSYFYLIYIHGVEKPVKGFVFLKY